MKNKLIYCLTLFFTISAGLPAQNNAQAEKMIADFIKSVEKNAIQTNFIMNITDQNGSITQTLSGVFTMKNDKFSLKTDDVNVFFNGKTQWTYLPSNNEVSITEPTEEELAEVNPVLILKEYRNKCNISLSADNKSNDNYLIEMTPRVVTDFKKILVRVNKTTKNLVSLHLEGKEFSVVMNFSNFRQGLNISDNTFVFDKSKYKDVFINDLR